MAQLKAKENVEHRKEDAVHEGPPVMAPSPFLHHTLSLTSFLWHQWFVHPLALLWFSCADITMINSYQVDFILSIFNKTQLRICIHFDLKSTEEDSCKKSKY